MLRNIDAIAQQEERQTFNLEVAGSSPVSAAGHNMAPRNFKAERGKPKAPTYESRQVESRKQIKSGSSPIAHLKRRSQGTG